MTDGELPVRLHGTHLGELVGAETGRSGRGGSVVLRWSRDAEERWGLNSPVLSRSLRVGFSSPDLTDSFFGALLPEGRHLERLAAETKSTTTDLLGLLTRIGADLAGALQIGDPREAREPQLLTTEQIDQLLAGASGFLVGGGGSALPGFQRKLTLTRADGRWLRGNGTLPSTHILKPVAMEDRATVDSEHFTLTIAREIGLSPFETWVEQIGERAVLVVERYDRRRRDSGFERLHQEDAGQAIGLPWGGNEKFEQNDARASLASVAALLDPQRTVFAPGRPDTEKLLRYTTLNVASGNTDAHAKNFSLLHDHDGATTLAPFYDAAPLALAYGATQSLSMRVNGRWSQPDITRADLVAEAVSWGLAETRAAAVVDDTLARIVEATRVVPAHPSISAHIPGYIREQAKNLAAGKAARISSPIPLMAQKHIGTPQPR
ncbi:HipA domain-containing protein [Herbiconiux sp. CPCC 205763]|uniref:HipA domain-containing protein n=1 Tax=Herbiconiux aconitum TaxID=2970913 RepID=A0ABT2GQ34_9MICO|nr:HipA domain-containing protein [Herbiconiux aconitum]MCS5718283.1 HipA domain-containing protein [Herbiconiux aconitum]